MNPEPFQPFLNRLENDEEDRNDEQQGDGTDDHTADGANTQRVVTIGSDTGSEGQGQQTKHHCQ